MLHLLKASQSKKKNPENVARDTGVVPDEIHATQLNRTEDCSPMAKQTDFHAVALWRNWEHSRW